MKALALTFTFAIVSVALAQPHPAMSNVAHAYVDRALTVIEKNSIKRDTDWKSVRAAAFGEAANAQTPKDTYLAIKNALKKLGDHHSFFLSPEEARSMNNGEALTTGIDVFGGYIGWVYPGSPAEKAGVKAGMKIDSIGGVVPSSPDASVRAYYTAEEAASAAAPLTFEAEDGAGQRHQFRLVPTNVNLVLMPTGRVLSDRIGFLNVPGYEGSKEQSKQYATTLHNLIRDMESAGVREWIVDLRCNGGGNMYPMICGVGPLLGDATLGYFVYANNKVPWWYRNGRSGQAREVDCKVDHPYRLRTEHPPIVVLTSHYSASAAEATLLSFEGLPNVHVLGEPTHGQDTANDIFKLSDGALVVLTVSSEADRTGRVYTGPVQPDLAATTDWSRCCSPDDPVIAQAIAVLKQP